ncbi:Crp/Fnr family transcriptional regulator [Ravibacter arvi]|uniref:Crp/Fnr family transcriptional regulator n=1 Tax=Ravibacter arvi TaxID=2051041 RepID=A0ABP8M0P9_9BACT
MTIIEYISTITNPGEEARKKISAVVSRLDLARKTLLYQEGQAVNHLFFIESGLLRMYYVNRQGKEITYGFYAEGQFVTVPESFFSQTSSRYYLELLENSVLQQLSYADFILLTREFPEVKDIENHVLRYFLRISSERIVALQFQTAEERYQALHQSLPTILQRAPLGAIASYLGIAQETLSRIRAKKVM